MRSTRGESSRTPSVGSPQEPFGTEHGGKEAVNEVGSWHTATCWTNQMTRSNGKSQWKRTLWPFWYVHRRKESDWRKNVTVCGSWQVNGKRGDRIRKGKKVQRITRGGNPGESPDPVWFLEEQRGRIFQGCFCFWPAKELELAFSSGWTQTNATSQDSL